MGTISSELSKGAITFETLKEQPAETDDNTLKTILMASIFPAAATALLGLLFKNRLAHAKLKKRNRFAYQLARRLKIDVSEFVSCGAQGAIDETKYREEVDKMLEVLRQAGINNIEKYINELAKIIEDPENDVIQNYKKCSTLHYYAYHLGSNGLKAENLKGRTIANKFLQGTRDSIDSDNSSEKGKDKYMSIELEGVETII